jgi:hypothetical protein
MSQPADATPQREPLDPGTHLRLSVLAYVAVNLAYGLPIMLWPDLVWGTLAGANDVELELLAGFRWSGAILVAWAVGGLLVLSRPEGRQTMVTTFALQYTLAAAALVLSAVADEFFWAETWFVLLSIAAITAVGGYLWYGRWAGRRALNG